MSLWCLFRCRFGATSTVDESCRGYLNEQDKEGKEQEREVAMKENALLKGTASFARK